ncbi:LysR family transcriptional regulator [Undibacterium seohonense]|uniref:LysR family transcriptional regulator n=1 Tax=Undibacterium seohonense TaxID=1344950 RepID=A0ABR6X0K6_9BURK|nr:LysR family transcriptional regulator [Undibacterium seohonense]MBC3806306.1 LysR family transcriptional regulator [Undibacterium seohonense]
MNLSFRQLKLLLAVAEHRSITAAANACHITQPTVSMQLKAMSDEVGLSLYEVIGKQVFLTAAGEAVAQSARTIRDEFDYLQQTISAMKGHTEGRLRVAIASTAKYFVPRMLGNFYKQFPNIDIAFEVLNRDGVVNRLKSNADDLYIMSIPPEDLDLERHRFLDNPLVVIAAADHPLAQKKRIKRKDLANELFVLREAGSGTRLACNAYFAEHQFQPKVRLELGSNEAIKQAVAGGLGLAIISKHALHQNVDAEGLKILAVENFPIHSNWWIIYPKGKRLSPIAKVFFEHLQDWA